MISRTDNRMVQDITDVQAAHHVYERTVLIERDEAWATWYAAFLIGRGWTSALRTDLADDLTKIRWNTDFEAVNSLADLGWSN